MTDSKWTSIGAGAVATKWYGRTLDDEAGNPTLHGTRRAVRARLRRARTPLEVMQEPEALRLIEELSGEHPDRVAILVGILAFVEKTDDRKVARAIGRASLDDDEAIVSKARFRRLLQTPGDALLDPMRRLVHLTKGKANVYDLSVSVLSWDDVVRKKRWIFDYYNVSESISARGAASGAPPVSTAT